MRSQISGQFNKLNLAWNDVNLGRKYGAKFDAFSPQKNEVMLTCF